LTQPHGWVTLTNIEEHMSEKVKKERTSITIDPELLTSVKSLADKRDQSVSQFISTALKVFIDQNDK